MREHTYRHSDTELALRYNTERGMLFRAIEERHKNRCKQYTILNGKSSNLTSANRLFDYVIQTTYANKNVSVLTLHVTAPNVVCTQEVNMPLIN